MINFANYIPTTSKTFDECRCYYEVTAFCFEDDTNQVLHQTFKKDVEIFIRDGRMIIAFDCFASYRLDTLEYSLGEKNEDELFCLDAYGSNHGLRGKSVYVKWVVVKQLIEVARNLQKQIEE